MQLGDDHRKALGIGEETRKRKEVRSWDGRNAWEKTSEVVVHQRKRQRIALSWALVG